MSTCGHFSKTSSTHNFNAGRAMLMRTTLPSLIAQEIDSPEGASAGPTVVLLAVTNSPTVVLLAVTNSTNKAIPKHVHLLTRLASCNAAECRRSTRKISKSISEVDHQIYDHTAQLQNAQE
jgi:hypothetical protein